MLTETAANRAVYWTDSFSDDVATAPNSFIYGYKSGTFRNLILGTIGATSELAGVTLTAQANGPFGGLYLYQGSFEIMFQPGSSLFGFYPSGRMLVSSDTAISPQAVIHAYESTAALDSGTGILIENGGSAGDAKLQLYLSAATSQNWVIGIDRSNGRSLSIAPGTDLGVALGITISPAGLVGIGNSTPGSLLDVRGASLAQVVVSTTTDTSASVANFVAATNGSDVLLYNRVSDTLATGSRYGVPVGGAAEIIASGAGLTSLAIGTNNLNVPIVFGQASAERMRIDNGGFVGIGPNAASPAYPLHVWNNQTGTTWLAATNDTSAGTAGAGLLALVGANYIYMAKRPAGYTAQGIVAPNDGVIYNFGVGDIAIRNTVTTGQIKLAVGATTIPHLVIDSTGFVGIGTASPSVPLHIFTSNQPLVLERTTTGLLTNQRATVTHYANSATNIADGYGPYESFHISDDTAPDVEIARIGAARNGADNSGRLEIWTSLAGVTSRALIVDSNNRVGINIIAPTKALHIGGGGGSALRADDGIFVNPNNVIVQVTAKNTSNVEGGFFVHSNGQMYIGSWGPASTANLIFRANNVDRMTLAAASGILSVPAGVNFGQNTLSYYAEGTWVVGVTIGGTAATIVSRSATYTVVGNLCTCFFTITFTKGALTGQVVLTGLPFAAQSTAMGPILFSGLAAPGIIFLIGYSGTATQTIYLYQTSAQATSFTLLSATQLGTSNNSLTGSLTFAV